MHVEGVELALTVNLCMYTCKCMHVHIILVHSFAAVGICLEEQFNAEATGTLVLYMSHSCTVIDLYGNVHVQVQCILYMLHAKLEFPLVIRG